MVKKLLGIKVLVCWLFTFSIAEGYGQECTDSVNISTDTGTTICAGTEVTFTANINGGESPVFQWQINGNNVGTNSNIYSDSTLSNADKVKVIVSSGNSDSTCSKESNTLTFTVNPERTPTVGISTAKTSICPGESITFNTSNTHGGTNPQYAWYINDSNTVAKTGASATFSASDFSEGDNNSVRVVLTSSINCANPATAEATSATFSLKPDASISTPTNQDQTVCINKPIENIVYDLGGGATNATVTGLPPGVTGSLSGGDYVISGSPTTAGEFNYTVSTTGTCAQITTTGTITVNPDATIALTLGNATQTVCAAGGVADGNISPITYSIGETGTGAEVIGLPSGIDGTYDVSTKNFTISGKSSVTGTHSYTVKATGDCADSAPLTGSIVITENKVPSVSITSNASDNTICDGNTLTFTATPVDGGVNPTYQWKVDGTNAGSNRAIFTTTSLEDGDVVTVEMTSSETCLTTATVVSNVITTTVNPNLTPEVTIVADNTDICPGDRVTFTATSVHGGANPSYQWKIGNSNVGSNNNEFTTTELTNGQSVSVILKSTETCLATSTATSNSIVTTVQPPAPARPGTISGPLEVCNGSTNTYSISAITNADQYVWTLPDGSTEITDVPEISFQMNRAGETTISVLAENTCYTSDGRSTTITSVDGVPDTPGEIYSSLPDDNKNICPPLDNLKFWIDEEVENADSYNWILPNSGWEIVDGAGTKEIIVRVTSATTNGSKEVKVEAVNICGNSEAHSTYSGIVVDTHIIADVGEDKTVCKTENLIAINGTRSFGSANLTTNFTTSGSGSFTDLPSGNNKNGPFSIQYAPSDEDKEAGQVKITIDVPEPSGNNNRDNDCGSATDEMFIYFKPDAKITDATNKDQTVCISSAIEDIEFTLEGTISGATVSGLPAGVMGNYSDGRFTITGAPSAAGTYDYTVEATGECGVANTTGTITVDELTIVEAGEAATDIVCQSTAPQPITLTGATFGGGATSATWAITSGGGSLSNTGETNKPAEVTYTPEADFSGDIILTLTTDKPGKCAAVSATRTITVQPAPTVDAGTAETDIACQSDNPTAITLTGAKFGGGATAAAWEITSGGGTLSSTNLSSNPQNVTYTPAAGYDGEVILTLISDAPGVCSAVSDIRTITVERAPIVSAGEAATDVVCQSPDPAEINLTGASFGGGATSAAWSITSGEGTLSSTSQTTTPESVTFTPLANFTGEVVLTLTSNAPGTCAVVNDTRIITIEPAAIVEAGGIEEGEEGGCQSPTPGAITLSGASLSGGAVTAAWSITEGGGTLSSTAQTSQPELVTYTPAPDFTGTVTLTLTSAPVGNCSADSDTRLIRITEALTVDAGEDVDVCSGSTVTLSDIELGEGVSSGRWEIISGQGELSSTTETANPETVTFTAPNQFKGEVVLRLTSNNPEGLCEEIFDERIINIQQEVTITTPPINLGICSTQDATFEVVASGDNLTYQWLFEGTDIQGATDARLVVNQATSEDAGAYTVRITGEVSCGEPVVSEPVTLNVDEDILIDAQPAGGNYCVGSTVNLSMEASAGGAELIYEWFNSNNETVGTGASIAIENVQTSDSGDYYAIITGPTGFTCSTATSETATVIVNPAPVIESIGAVIEICSEGEEVSITSGVEVSNESSIEWSVPEGMGTISNATSLTNATYAPSGATGTVELSLTVQGLDGCSEITETKSITITPQPIITEFSYSSTEFCETDIKSKTPTLTGENAFDGGTFLVEPATGLSIDTAGNIDPSTSASGNYIITYSTPENALCDPVISSPVTIVIGEEPIAAFSYDQNIYCKDTRDDNINVNPAVVLGEGASAGEFTYVGPGNLSLNHSSGTIDLSSSDPGEYTITNTYDLTGDAEDGCIAVEDSYTITITEKPIADFTYGDEPFCSNDDNPLPTFLNDGVAGVFTAPIGVVINSESGEINLLESEAGSHTITNTIAAAGGCEEIVTTAEIAITALPVATFEYEETAYCKATATNPTPTISGNQGGTFTGSTGLFIDPDTGVIDLSASNANNPNDDQDKHTITYSFPAADGCGEVSKSVQIRIDGKPVGGELKFAGLDRATYLVCHDATSGSSRAIELSGHHGKVLKWQKSHDPSNPNSWINIDHTEDSYSDYSGLTKTTLFRAVLSSGSCDIAYSKFAVISVIPADIQPDPVQASSEEICIGTEIQLTSELNYSSNTEIAEGGAFDNAQPDGWTSDSCKNENCLSSGNSNQKGNGWALSASNNQSWSGVSYASDGKFAIAHSVDYSVMETPVFSTFGLTEATLEFNHSYKLDADSSIRIEISEDGGATYNTANPLLFVSGSATLTPHNNFPEMNIELDEYVGRSNLRIRFIFDGTADENDNTGSSWAVDNIAIPDRPVNVASEWNYTNAQGEEISVENEQNITVKPDKIGLNTFKITSYLLTDDGAECRSADPNNSETVDVYVFDKYTSNATANVGICGQNNFHLSAEISAQEQGNDLTFPTLDGYSAPYWKVEGPAGYSFINPDPNDGSEPEKNPNAIFVAPNEGTYTLTWAIERNVNDGRSKSVCPPTVNTATVVVKNCSTLDFDGVDDYVDLGEGYTGDFSIEAWIRPEAATGTIISTPTLEINMEDLPIGVTPNIRWYHIAVDSDGILYIDGIKSGSISKTGNDRTIIGARWNGPNSENHFSGWIEEVRIWNENISQENIRFTMNQRLKADGNIGVVVDMDHPDAPDFDDLAGYYQLIATDILNGGYTPDLSGSAVNGKLRNMETHQENTAPLPYTTSDDGFWTDEGTDIQNGPWTHWKVWDIPNSTGIDGTPIEWNIVRTSHNVSSQNKDITLLGLISEENRLTIAEPKGAQNELNSGQFLRLTHYLRLDGEIDLMGESQLLQDTESIVDNGSTGFLERDQQGTASSYNYNYWSSPVSPGTGNAPYTISSVMKDGWNFDADGSPKDINFGNPYAHADGAASNPIKISNYWLHKFHGTANSYGQWHRVGSTGELKVGEGYSMKGTSGGAAITAPQNYTFKGIPNNGEITLMIGNEENYLIGNPYPSAIDAEEFLFDNMKDLPDGEGRNDEGNMFDGTLYFWSHFANKTHYLEEYIGGYAAFNLSGAVRATANDARINATNDKGGEIPERYIPVGQAFFVNTRSSLVNITGGEIKFKNSQRIYERETDGQSVFHKPQEYDKLEKGTSDGRSKIWLKFRSPTGYHRQLLVTADPVASNDFDLGYDAPLIENNAEDMYWFFSGHEFVIQGVGDFNEDQILALGMKIIEEGEFSIEIDQLKNIPDDMNIYLKDSIKDTYHDLRKAAFDSVIEAGDFNDRFQIVFKKPEPPQVEPEIPEDITSGKLEVLYVNNSREVIVRNPELLSIERIYLNNILGQQVHVYINIMSQEELKLPVNRFSSGVYIVKLHTEEGIVTKKILLE